MKPYEIEFQSFSSTIPERVMLVIEEYYPQLSPVYSEKIIPQKGVPIIHSKIRLRRGTDQEAIEVTQTVANVIADIEEESRQGN